MSASNPMVCGPAVSPSSRPEHALVIAPHHDDETIGCGGTILRLVAAGWLVVVVHVFDGSTGITKVPPAECRRIRNAEARAAAEILGHRLGEPLNIPDRTVDDPGALLRPLVAALRRHAPSLVFAPHLEDSDFEHRLVSRAVDDAFWMMSSGLFPDLGPPTDTPAALLGYEVWRPIADVTLSVDIGAYMERKAAALRCFASQDEAARWVAGASGLAAYRGTTLRGGGYAEAYTLRRAGGSKLSLLGALSQDVVGT